MWSWLKITQDVVDNVDGWMDDADNAEDEDDENLIKFIG